MVVSLMATLMWAAAGLLLVGGVAKIKNPLDPIPALRAVGLPAHRLAVIALGAGEVVVASLCLIVPSTVPLLMMGVLYLAFAAFIAALTAKQAPGLSCGCAGRRYIPPSYLHAGLNLLGALASLSVAFSPAVSLPHLLDRAGVFGFSASIVGLTGIASAAYLAVAYVTTLYTSYKQTA